MNDEINPIKGHRHSGMQSGCCHWAPIFALAVDDEAEPGKVPVTSTQGDEAEEPVEPGSG